MKLKKTLLLGVVFFLIGISSCSKFLDVKPLDSIMEDELFTSVKGFNTAINGVYIELNSPEIYGENMSVGLIDVMGQYYNVSTTAEHAFRYFNTYDYGTPNFKGKIEAIWQKSYSLIVNLNAILMQADKKQSLLGDTNFNLYKGEALALRSYLHFDLLRLFGSTFPEDADLKAIPYVTNIDRAVQPLLPNSEVIAKIKDDLLLAKELLSTADPILTKGVLNFDGGQNNYQNFRQYRMNYFAVCGLLSRVYLWEADQANAYKYALEVINKGQVESDEVFPFITSNAVNNRPGYSDRLFSTEVIFALYNSNRTSVFNRLFNSSLNASSRLTFTGTLDNGRFKLLYPDENDYRKIQWEEPTVSGSKVLFFSKFADVSDLNGISTAYRYMMPLMRISEMYLIAAETANSLQESNRYYNAIQIHRGLPEVTFATEMELEQAIQTEYLKEFIGEGQTYFYFKRLRATDIPSPVRPGVDVIKMDKVHYIMPLPDSETSQRN